jgi:hypothetical protein
VLAIVYSYNCLVLVFALGHCFSICCGECRKTDRQPFWWAFLVVSAGRQTDTLLEW